MANVRKQKLLIADDSALLRSGLAALISDLAGIEIVAQAGDCIEAMDAVRLWRPDIAILDLSMPGGSGLEVLRHIKEEHPDTIVIIFSLDAQRHFRDICKRLGAEFFFEKPSELAELQKSLHRLSLQGRR